jgi:uncharacterized protein (TIGR03067 family)
MGTRASATVLMVFWALVLGVGWSLSGSAAHTRADDEKSSADVLKTFQGTWIPADEQGGLDSKWTFEGESLKATVNGMDYTCKVKLDPKAKPHPTVDFIIEEGPEDSKGKTSKCIYKLDGEKLTLCVSTPGKDRPKEFEQVEDEAYLFELKKQKRS